MENDDDNRSEIALSAQKQASLPRSFTRPCNSFEDLAEEQKFSALQNLSGNGFPAGLKMGVALLWKKKTALPQQCRFLFRSTGFLAEGDVPPVQKSG